MSRITNSITSLTTNLITHRINSRAANSFNCLLLPLLLLALSVMAVPSAQASRLSDLDKEMIAQAMADYKQSLQLTEQQQQQMQAAMETSTSDRNRVLKKYRIVLDRIFQLRDMLGPQVQVHEVLQVHHCEEAEHREGYLSGTSKGAIDPDVWVVSK